MLSLRKLICKPRVDDWAPLAKFFHADEQLNTVAAELDSFDGTKDPEKNQRLINQLRHCQDRVIQIIEEILNDAFPEEADRARRDYRVKFPDDIIHEGLAGQLWFGAECLSAGTNIVDRIAESENIRPLARRLTQHLDHLRDLLKEQSLKNPYIYSDKLKKQLKLFDHLFAEFELRYVSIMIPVKSAYEYDLLQDVCVLFSETLIRSIKKGYIHLDMIDMCDPSIMITLPRLAIVCGLLIYPEGPLKVDKPTEDLAEMFQSFKTLLQKIRDLLRTLTEEELGVLEKALSSQEQLCTDKQKVALMSEFRGGGNNNGGGGKKSGSTSSRRKSFSSASSNAASSFYKSQTPPQITTSTIEAKNVKHLHGGGGSDDDESSSARRNSVGEKADGDDEIMSDSGKKSSSNCDDSRDNTAAAAGVVDGPEVYCAPAGLTGLDDKKLRNDINLLTPASRKLRARFWSPDDLIHRLFVCIAGVADQWQSNYPADLRLVLKTVLHPQPSIPIYEVRGRPTSTAARVEETGVEVSEPSPFTENVPLNRSLAPDWVPDDQCSDCSGCGRPFTFTLRRHHCRNCGHIFCYSCSANFFPLAHLGYGPKAVRVCDQCFFGRLTESRGGSGAAESSRNAAVPGSGASGAGDSDSSTTTRTPDDDATSNVGTPN